MSGEQDNQYTYEYYTNGVWPIRAARQSGIIVGTETPNIETGDLKIDMHWMTKVVHDTSGEINKISKEQFDAKCVEFITAQREKITLAP